MNSTEKTSAAFPMFLVCLVNGIDYSTAMRAINSAYRLGDLGCQAVAEEYENLAQIDYIRSELSKTEDEVHTEEWFATRIKLAQMRDSLQTHLNNKFPHSPFTLRGEQLGIARAFSRSNITI